MRESRDKDNTRRAIRKVTGELTKLYEHPKEGSYIPDYLLDKVMPVLQLANEVTGNRETAERLAGWRQRGEDGWHYTPMQDTKTEMDAAVDGLRRGIQREMEAGDRANLEWEQSGLTDAIDSWLADVNDNRQREIARLEEAIQNAQKLGDEYGGIDGTVMEAHLNALQEKLDGKDTKTTGNSDTADTKADTKKDTASTSSGTKEYTVKEKDTMWTIAQSQLGNGADYQKILDANGLKEGDTLVPGTVIKIPQ